MKYSKHNDLQTIGTDIRVNPPLHMTVREAATYVNLSERKLRDYIAQRDLKIVRFGSKIICRKHDLDNFIESLAR